MPEEICKFCLHEAHGVASTGGKGCCRAIVNSLRSRECKCDGKTQWFSSPLLSEKNAREWAQRAQAAGYTIYIFNANDITVRAVGSDGAYLNDDDGCMACVFSDTLPPAASRQEFEERCNMPERLRWKQDARAA